MDFSNLFPLKHGHSTYVYKLCFFYTIQSSKNSFKKSWYRKSCMTFAQLQISQKFLRFQIYVFVWFWFCVHLHSCAAFSWRSLGASCDLPEAQYIAKQDTPNLTLQVYRYLDLCHLARRTRFTDPNTGSLLCTQIIVKSKRLVAIANLCPRFKIGMSTALPSQIAEVQPLAVKDKNAIAPSQPFSPM